MSETYLSQSDKILRSRKALEILQLLKNRKHTKGKSFTQIARQTKFSPRTVSKWLKELCRRELVERKLDGTYMITELGLRVSSSPQLSRSHYSFSVPISEKIGGVVDLSIPAEFLILGDFSSYALTFDRILSSMGVPMSWFTNIIYEMADEFERRVLPSPDVWSPRHKIQQVNWFKRAFDFDLTLMIQFLGKTHLKDQDWHEIEQRAIEEDRRFTKESGSKKYRLALEKVRKDFYSTMLKTEVTTTLTSAHREIARWLDQKTERAQLFLARSEEELIEKASRWIDQNYRQLFQGEGLRDGHTVIDSMISSGAIEIKEMKLYMFAQRDIKEYITRTYS